MPLVRGKVEERRWMDCNLASYAENRLGQVADPLRLDEQTRTRWTATVLEGRLPRPREHRFISCYWIMRGGEVAGTLALARTCLGPCVNAYSVYVRPSCRGGGIMAATLRTVRQELEAHGIGLAFEVNWTWNAAVRYYLRNGFWLRSWKHALNFVWIPGTPPPRIMVGAREASLAMEQEGGTTVLARARRGGGRLLRFARPAGLLGANQALDLRAPTTLALALALAGWPLVRSRRHAQRWGYCDLVHPEALADRIQAWEAWTAAQGWRVETPRIPGLAYPTWAELRHSSGADLRNPAPPPLRSAAAPGR
ncbi:MAG: GNAT family N-acetyltransferase [Gemmatimonadota bacterium]